MVAQSNVDSGLGSLSFLGTAMAPQFVSHLSKGSDHVEEGGSLV